MWKSLNPLAQSVEYTLHLTKILILKLERIIGKISYERRIYESADVAGAYLGLYLTSLRKSGVKWIYIF